MHLNATSSKKLQKAPLLVTEKNARLLKEQNTDVESF